MRYKRTNLQIPKLMTARTRRTPMTLAMRKKILLLGALVGIVLESMFWGWYGMFSGSEG